MVVSRKDSYQAFGFDKSFHKAIVAMVVAVVTIAVVLMTNDLCVDTWLSAIAAAVGPLQSTCSLNGYMNKG
jgi:hypothetical protein